MGDAFVDFSKFCNMAMTLKKNLAKVLFFNPPLGFFKSIHFLSASLIKLGLPVTVIKQFTGKYMLEICERVIREQKFSWGGLWRFLEEMIWIWSWKVSRTFPGEMCWQELSREISNLKKRKKKNKNFQCSPSGVTGKVREKYWEVGWYQVVNNNETWLFWVLSWEDASWAPNCRAGLKI